MYKLMVMGLIGEIGFMDFLIGMPEIFFELQESDREALWGAILGKINDGWWEIPDLINFARDWIGIFQSDMNISGQLSIDLINH